MTLDLIDRETGCRRLECDGDISSGFRFILATGFTYSEQLQNLFSADQHLLIDTQRKINVTFKNLTASFGSRKVGVTPFLYRDVKKKKTKTNKKKRTLAKALFFFISPKSSI